MSYKSKPENIIWGCYSGMSKLAEFSGVGEVACKAETASWGIIATFQQIRGSFVEGSAGPVELQVLY